MVVQALAQIWADLPGYDRENIDEWLSRAVPAVLTAQRASALVTDAYLGQALGRGPIGFNPSELIGAAVRNGVALEEVYQRPFVTLWSKLGENAGFEAASSAALARVKSTAAMDVQLSMRATADAVDVADTSFYGYRRVADPGACPFCLEVDGAYIKAADGFAYALHNGCGCSMEPNTEPHRGAVHLPDGSRVRAYQYGPLNDNVAVEQHGELGAVLVAPGDTFTSQADLH